MKDIKKINRISLVLAISLVSSFYAPLPVKSYENSNFVCNTGEFLVFATENNNNQLVYTAFKGNYNSVERPERDPDLVLYNGRTSFIRNGDRKVMLWRAAGGYTYQVIAYTLKSEDDFKGNLIVKRNGRTIISQPCLIGMYHSR